MAFDVAVIGAVGIDTNVYLSDSKVNLSVETSFGENLDCIGQAGGYACQGFERLGYRVCFVGYVGEDFSGKYIRQILTELGIDTSLLMIDPLGTKRSVNLMYMNGGRKNFYDGKGAMNLCPNIEDIRSHLSGTKLAHVNIVNWTRFLLKPLKEEGLILSVDIQDVTDSDDPYRKDFIEEADVLFFSSTNFADPYHLIKKYLEIRGDRIVVCGMGKRGCAIGSNKGIEHFDPVELEEPVVDANGAGDSLAVGFLSSHYFEGYSIEDAILRGQIAARYCCTKKGTSSELITSEHLDRLFKQINTSRKQDQ